MPEFFDEDFLDPMNAAIGPDKGPAAEGRPEFAIEGKKTPPGKVAGPDKKKAGFYLSRDLLDRFNKRFHELKIEGANIDNKSALLEIALHFALDEMDKGEKSTLLNKIKNR